MECQPKEPLQSPPKQKLDLQAETSIIHRCIAKLFKKYHKCQRRISKYQHIPNAHYYGDIINETIDVQFPTLTELMSLIATNPPYPTSMASELFTQPIHNGSTFLILEHDCHERVIQIGAPMTENQKSFDYVIVYLEALIENLVMMLYLSSSHLYMDGGIQLYGKMRMFLVENFAEAGLHLSEPNPHPSLVYQMSFNTLREIINVIIRKMLTKLKLCDTYLHDVVPSEFFDFLNLLTPSPIFISRTGGDPADAIFRLKEFRNTLAQTVKIRTFDLCCPGFSCPETSCLRAPKCRDLNRWCLPKLKRYLRKIVKMYKRSRRILKNLQKIKHAHYYQCIPMVETYFDEILNHNAGVWLMITNRCQDKSYRITPNEASPCFKNACGFDYMMVSFDYWMEETAKLIVASSLVLSSEPSSVATVKAGLVSAFVAKGLYIPTSGERGRVYKIQYEDLRSFLYTVIVHELATLAIIDSHLSECPIPRQFFDLCLVKIEGTYTPPQPGPDSLPGCFFFVDGPEICSNRYEPYYSYKKFPRWLELALGARCLML